MTKMMKFVWVLCLVFTSAYAHAQVPTSLLPVPGYITSLLGNGTSGGVAPNPLAPVLDSHGDLYFISQPSGGNSGFVYKLTTATGVVTLVAGGGSQSACSQKTDSIGDGCPATQVNFYPYSLAVDGSGNLFIADTVDDRIREVSASTGIITTVAGSGANSCETYNSPLDMLSGSSGVSFSGDGGAATAATLACPTGVALDASGNIYIADTLNNRVRKVTSGIINTIAGSGAAATCQPEGSLGTIVCTDVQASETNVGDGGSATSALINAPQGVAIDGSGNILIADTNNYRIRKVSGGIITTVAGTGYDDYSGDGGPATSAEITAPASVSVDTGGNVYFGNSGKIREVSLSQGGKIPNGYIEAIVGGGTGCSTQSDSVGDDCPVLDATLSNTPGLVLDSKGFIYIADFNNDRLRIGSPYNSNGAGSGGTCNDSVCSQGYDGGNGIPTLPQWAAIGMGGVLLLIGIATMRKQQRGRSLTGTTA